MNTDTGRIYLNDEIKQALKRGEPLTELTREEYDDLIARSESERIARLAELRARPHRSKGSRKRRRR